MFNSYLWKDEEESTMKAKVLGGFLIVSMLVGAMISAVPAAASPPLPDYKPVDIGPKLREVGPSDVTLHTEGFEEALTEAQASSASETPEFYGEGDIKTAIWYDDTAGLYLAEYEVKAIGEHIEVWVMTDLNFPDGDPRNPVVVTDEQIQYLVDEYDNNIYPQMVSFFGPPDFHDGSAAALPFDYFDSEGRTIAMISNIGDESYYDPTYPNYIAGFYWGSVFELYLDRNVISIDAYDWENRVGPDVARPYLYEGVFAHEYQHLLHDDYDPGEVNWINEGLSMFAEFFTGYAGEDNGAYSTFEALPENSLTAWGDQGDREIVADYGNVFLFHMYLYEHFGQDFMYYEFHNPLHDISSINDTLSTVGASTTFEDLYHDFSVAVLIDEADDDAGDGYPFGFVNHDVAIDIGHPGKRNPDAYDTPGAPPWGTDYYLLWGYESLAGLEFNGVRFNPDWTSDGDALYSGAGNLLDNWAIFEATGGGTLTFDSYWDIEDYWDFGFVQVSNDGGATWTSLPGDYTTSDHDPAAHPDIVANLPGLTSWSCFVDPGPEVPVDCWINLEYDLSAYAGEDILIAFRFMTDWGTYYEGWYVDNVMVDGTLISDGSSADDFMSYAEFMGIENQYTVTLVAERKVKGKTEYAVEKILTGDYMASFADFKQIFEDYHTVVMLVTFDADEGTTTYADYSYEFLNGGGKVFKNNR
jgi:hypothetical protein